MTTLAETQSPLGSQKVEGRVAEISSDRGRVMSIQLGSTTDSPKANQTKIREVAATGEDLTVLLLVPTAIHMEWMVEWMVVLPEVHMGETPPTMG